MRVRSDIYALPHLVSDVEKKTFFKIKKLVRSFSFAAKMATFLGKSE